MSNAFQNIEFSNSRLADSLAITADKYLDFPTVTWAMALVRAAHDRPSQLRYAQDSTIALIESAKRRLMRAYGYPTETLGDAAKATPAKALSHSRRIGRYRRNLLPPRGL
jgi:hypothetical protein